jgi:3-methyladenine DNA glycosylase Mpg
MERPARRTWVLIAPDLVGAALLVRGIGGIIVETEACSPLVTCGTLCSAPHVRLRPVGGMSRKVR